MTDPLIQSLREIHSQVSMVGWDFSRLDGQLTADEPWWDFEQDCADAMKDAARILDLGTGGGERLLRLMGNVDVGGKKLAATEGWEPNVEVAKTALQPHGVEVVEYDAERDDKLPFDDASFDLVMCRHEAIDATEVARVLADGGRLLVQQVDGRDAEEIHEWFDEPFAYLHVTSANDRQAFEAVGLSIDQLDEWAGTMEFADTAALVTYLGLVPWDAPNFTVDAHAERLLALEAARCIRVTQRRYRIYATKR